MAEVTGFTADRMRIIENETVVDGEVQGDNLILVTREGTPIDAGNVRGPQGIQGVAGPVQSVNEQLGAVFTPRVFADKATLDLWITAPNGTEAFTIAEGATWYRIKGAWAASTGPRIFADQAALNANWGATAPVGSQATTLADHTNWYKDSIGWITNVGTRIFATPADRDAHWPNPPDGAKCWTNKHVEWTYFISEHKWYLTGNLGLLAQVERYSNAGPVGMDLGPVAISGMEINFSLLEQKWVRIAAFFRHCTFNRQYDYGVVGIYNRDGNLIQDALIQTIQSAGGWLTSQITVERFLVLQAGAHRFYVQAWAQVGGASMTLNANGNSPMWIAATAH